MKSGKRDGYPGSGIKPYSLVHQTLCITDISFETKCLIGYVEMTIQPHIPNLKSFKLNCKQCVLYSMLINQRWDATFSYHDPTLEICKRDFKQRNLDNYKNAHANASHSVDSTLGNGEVTVQIPSDAYSAGMINEMMPFTVTIEFSLEEPRGGMRFVVSNIDGTLVERGAHLYTYGRENSSRLWFPCMDSFSELCTWKLEITVDMYMIAISSGDLIETVYTSDLRQKTYHYYLSVPTSAPNIALAVGPFEFIVDETMPEVTHFCLPSLKPLLHNSTSKLTEIFECFEDFLSSRYPFSSYKQVFVDEAYDEFQSFSTMSIFSHALLHPPTIIDQVPIMRNAMANALAKQFFGCFIVQQSWNDAWLTKGISAFLAGLYFRKTFGNNEYKHMVFEKLQAIQNYEFKVGGIVLDPAAVLSRNMDLHFSTAYAQTTSDAYLKAYEKKAFLVMRLLESRLGPGIFLQSLNKLLSLAMTASNQKYLNFVWTPMLLSTDSFLRGIATVSGKDVNTFLDLWVRQPGLPKFHGNFVFNRKRNIVELEIRQDVLNKGTMKYMGPITVAIQELDGTFRHTFNIEENKRTFEITCHSKSRRNKKKKIPLSTMEEVDMDLGAMDADSPVLWLRIDPELDLLRFVDLEQPDYMWQYMLRHERCIIAQECAISSLESFSTPQTRLCLTDCVENDKVYYRVRMQAAYCLVRVANQLAASWSGPPAMLAIFHKLFGSYSSPNIVRRNDFSNFQQYFLQKTIPVAMASSRTLNNNCPSDVMKFLLDLFKYNDNAKNKYSDNYYRAALIDALAATITPAITTVTLNGMSGRPSTELVSDDAKRILEEIVRYLNLEKLLPCYHRVVTVSCLRALRILQKFGHIPSSANIFKSYAVKGNFINVRLAALEALVDFMTAESNVETFEWLIDLIDRDDEPYITHRLAEILIEKPPFTKDIESCPLSSEEIVDKLWNMMNCKFHYDSRLRCDVVDLYHKLFGRRRPACLPMSDSTMVINLKESKLARTGLPDTSQDRIRLLQKKSADDLDYQDPFALARTHSDITATNDSNSNQGLKRKSDDLPSFDDDSSMPKVRIKVIKQLFVNSRYYLIILTK
ncbi:DgyrCDS1430 [Dimorphilus gyrociliatus]|uniref:Transcription initiation factor TFIID subunit 2 n=1 Tax=Dimorphilus gyrociliatus TaxID=2664684 RepID=A0A7I8V786_9ANNE|nr:DgyrCDS1430 [Dimorphilus gyrociliatus]